MTKVSKHTLKVKVEVTHLENKDKDISVTSRANITDCDAAMEIYRHLTIMRSKILDELPQRFSSELLAEEIMNSLKGLGAIEKKAQGKVH